MAVKLKNKLSTWWILMFIRSDILVKYLSSKCTIGMRQITFFEVIQAIFQPMLLRPYLSYFLLLCRIFAAIIVYRLGYWRWTVNKLKPSTCTCIDHFCFNLWTSSPTPKMIAYTVKTSLHAWMGFVYLHRSHSERLWFYTIWWEFRVHNSQRDYNIQTQ